MQPEVSLYGRLAGALLMGLGLFWRSWGVAAWYHGQLQQDGQRLITEAGPYRLCRNPRYVGNLWLGLGGCLWSGLPQLVPYTLLTWLFVHYPVICFEEETLLQRHGQAFAAYCQRTPRFPGAPSRLWLEQLRGLRWDRAFLAEFSTIEGWTVAALLIAWIQDAPTPLWTGVLGLWTAVRIAKFRIQEVSPR